MSQWYRVFGCTSAQPEPAALLEHLNGLGAEVAGHFRGDDEGWFAAELVFARDAPPLQLERYLAKEEGIRGELNAWAAWLETAGHGPLMQHVATTAQLFTLCRPADGAGAALVEKLCVGVCQFLARATAGVYQVDGAGFFAADGTVLWREGE
jgi:hypothetical protein